MLHGDLDNDIVLPARDIDWLVIEGHLVAVQILHEIANAALKIVFALLGVAALAQVGQLKSHALVEIGKLAQAARDYLEIHLDRFKNPRVGHKGHLGALAARAADLGQRPLGNARVHAVLILIAFKAHLIQPARGCDLYLDPFGKRVDDRSAHAVQTARIGVAVVAEFAAGVKLSENHLNAGNSQLFVYAHGYAAAVVFDRDRAVALQSNRDGVGIAVRRLVHGVVHDLPQKVVQTSRAGRAYIHARAHPDRLEPFHNLYIAYRIFVIHAVLSFYRFMRKMLQIHYIEKVPPCQLNIV